MKNDKKLASMFLILMLVSIGCDARARSEDWRNMERENEDQNSVLRSLEGVVKKRGCANTGESCKTSSDCCGGNNGCVGCSPNGFLCATFGKGCIGYLGRRVCYNRDGPNDGYIKDGVSHKCRDRFKQPHRD